MNNKKSDAESAVSKPEKHFIVRSKIWIEDEQGYVVFGEGRYRILEAVDRKQSLQGAALELKMSYRAVWGRLRASEERIGKALVQREGRGSTLTPFARKLMSQYEKLQARIHHESDEVYDILMSDYLDQ
ncbi:MAG: LysR family transcriptional regulator [Desulfobulbaceae bacterium]|nr:LysR family transcriptional regulator [Desulfobulbaceae bacterium]